jgi:hypothetical protein
MKITWIPDQSSGGLARLERLWRLTRGVALAALITTTVTNIYDLKQVAGTGTRPDEVARYAERVANLQKFLPVTGHVGYLTDVPADDISNNAEVLRRFILTQYTLVPILLCPGTDDSLIIGSFVDAAAAIANSKDFTVVKNFGHGLVLLRKQHQ